MAKTKAKATAHGIVSRKRRPGELFTARTAIRNHCVECMGYAARDVSDCTDAGCHLWPYRMGPRARPNAGMASGDSEA